MICAALRPHGSHHTGGQRGLTLVELLVSMVIIGMVVAVLSQALWQLSRIERLLQSGQLAAVTRDLRVEWLRAAVEALQPLRTDTADAFAGSEREMQGMTSQAPLPGQDGPQRIRLQFDYDADRDATRLRLTTSLSPDAVTLLSWPGQQGRLRYLAADGQWHDRWPQPGSPTDQRRWLPVAVAIETGLDTLPLIVAAPQLMAPGLLSRAEVQLL